MDKSRSESYFYNMRKFHNQIKRNLYNKYTKNIDNLLEIAVGRFGDMNKIISNNVKHVVGYDIDSDSIEEAKRRFNNTKNTEHITVELYTMDLSRNIIKPTIPFDVVSAMFCFHYFFENEQTFNTIFKSIDDNLKDGGTFIGTMFDGKNINNIELKDKNDTKFKIEKKNSIDTLFGNKITVYIKDTVLDKPTDEYIVVFDKFVDIMKTKNYELIESNMFETYFNTKYKLNNIEKKASFLNRTFVFKKHLSLN